MFHPRPVDLLDSHGNLQPVKPTHDNLLYALERFPDWSLATPFRPSGDVLTSQLQRQAWRVLKKELWDKLGEAHFEQVWSANGPIFDTNFPKRYRTGAWGVLCELDRICEAWRNDGAVMRGDSKFDNKLKERRKEEAEQLMEVIDTLIRETFAHQTHVFQRSATLPPQARPVTPRRAKTTHSLGVEPRLGLRTEQRYGKSTEQLQREWGWD